MTIRRTLGAACAVAALICTSGAAYADGGGYKRTYGKDKVEIYISVKSGAYADVDYVTHNRPSYEIPIGALEVTPVPQYPPHQKQKIKEETAKAWGEVKKVKIEAEGVTSGTWDAGYSSSASTHSKSQSSGGGGAGVASTSEPGGGNGCGCSSSSTTSASAGGGTSGSWSTGGGGGGGGDSDD